MSQWLDDRMTLALGKTIIRGERTMPNDYLAHHGIKGQKWGVRNGPPYPIDQTTMPKGTRLNSISAYLDSNAYKDQHKIMYTYNPNDTWDSAVYKGPFSYFLAAGRGKRYLAEHQYEVVSDLKMPTQKERIDNFIDMYKNDTKMVYKDLDYMQNLMKQHGVPGSADVYGVNLKNLQTREDYEAAYEIFNHAMEHFNRYKSTKAYMDIMATKYDAMVDDNNQGIYNDAHDPVIIFRANEALRAIAPARMMTANEIYDNLDIVKNELAKQGQKVKL